MKKTGILTIILIFAAGLSVSAAAADKNGTIKHDTVNEKKNNKTELEYKATTNMLDSMSFVLEAYNLRDAWGNMAIVPSTLNFIMVDSSIAVIQIGSNSRIGPNGVGGVTAKGTVSGWRLQKNSKHKSFTVFMTITTPIGIYDVNMFVSANGKATATISGLSRGKLIYDGDLVPLSESRVYEGRSL